ncbi:glyoxalase/bleomycin resistance protein/dioxygenase superfamily protein [Bacillus thuringiensis]|uniref:Glyoxalase/bleomycin resistance protein/dioxygenase superfamily protein n=1 Tax=Bacillus thuringiensis TaxID=1428 RepID=A0A4R4B6R8_BACTU|nr:VOC family protein [Bacillus thuringiensis]TCW49854.1 glyoxalase/bleomycin resistance protein/dioxygenase superfamily protein [Bacillus thuringiensis]TCW50087.1 glyoxalase/bleomycin resistance protein/dioxygenase superfamily protein [Bacillus thuringiensis]
MQLYVNDVEKSLLFYEKIIGLKLSIQMGIFSGLRLSKGKHEKCLPFLWKYSKK